ncbi:hypothetical protein CAEBREN_31739 [Caenorhabditis brenneri]|uniref:G-protein coupled receptors family 1 profile domain-containing protein n=1 Tax=Caenorhabditis brenneri TaxID=135651 RepID=G0PMN9_CAEBE|nr:hypothetical protein CAEBREN_31739 [Caenorhabditis brenneri]
MLGKQWSALLKLIQDVSAVFSISINSFLILLVLTKSLKQLGAYKWLMIYISVFEILYSILDVILVPQHYSHGPTFLVIVGIQHKLFGPAGLTLLNSFYWGFFGASMAVFAVHFVYRWLVVSE